MSVRSTEVIFLSRSSAASRCAGRNAISSSVPGTGPVQGSISNVSLR